MDVPLVAALLPLAVFFDDRVPLHLLGWGVVLRGGLGLAKYELFLPTYRARRDYSRPCFGVE